jgi:hypothetical protein
VWIPSWSGDDFGASLENRVDGVTHFYCKSKLEAFSPFCAEYVLKCYSVEKEVVGDAPKYVNNSHMLLWFPVGRAKMLSKFLPGCHG